jgi:ubiquinone/menaquinone biosynthesis C-methylase UbiE
MGIYSRFILPRLTHLAMGQRQLIPYRERVVGGARGRVLEIGIGSALNLPFYGSHVDAVIGVDVSPEMLSYAESAVSAAAMRVSLLAQSAERLPLDDRSVDTVVITWALCSIPDPMAALSEARRVLKPGGELRFVEHGFSPDPGVRRWQDRVTPLWRRVAGGCHLNRKPDDLIRAAGFEIVELATGYTEGPRMMTYLYEGRAVAR